MENKALQAFAYETITVPSANVTASLTKSKYRPDAGGLPVRKALVTVNPGPPVSYSMTTTITVASNTGHKMTAYGSLEVHGPDQIENFRTTSVSSATVGSIAVTYFR